VLGTNVLDKTTAMTSGPLIGITIGDPHGIGPEVSLKALANVGSELSCTPLLIGDLRVLENTAKALRIPLELKPVTAPHDASQIANVISVLDNGNFDAASVQLGTLSANAGKAAVDWVISAGNLAKENEIQAIVTAPINKEAARLAGCAEVGHMEIFQTLTGTSSCATMLSTGNLRVVHLTTHRSLRIACDYVTQDNVLDKLILTDTTFKSWGIENPSIGVAALNPHASDGGLIGSEEADHIIPAVNRAKALGLSVTGPIGADTVFHQAINGAYDVVLAMYHDQGHIPIKVHGFEKSISINLGFPFVRTSVDHGTAFDIAGKGIADSSSMEEALKTAANLAFGKGLPKI
jgi:4-hydroxythreonine-4-phosphate dehydrogenase